MMKKIFFLVGCLALSLPSFSQLSAVTQTGDEVILYDDGTWVYAHKDSINTSEITTNPQKFAKGDSSSFLLKSTRINVGAYINPKKWTFKKAGETEAAEYEINHTDLGLYGMMITEKLDLPLESLANIALDNARDAAPDVRVMQKEYRYINGLKVLMMRMTGTIQDIKFSYYGYYYSTPKGATQFLVYSSEDIVNENIGEIEQLLNGLVEINQ
ncbi:MAG: hypothetical protein ABIQ02_01835 [Saprospiraceae bacterium]